MSDEKSVNNLRSNGKDLSNELHGRFRSCVFWAWLCRRARRLSSVWRCRLHHLLQREVACVFLRAAPAAMEVRPAAGRGVLRRGKGSQARRNRQPRRRSSKRIQIQRFCCIALASGSPAGPLRLGAPQREERSFAFARQPHRILFLPAALQPLNISAKRGYLLCRHGKCGVRNCLHERAANGRQFGETGH